MTIAREAARGAAKKAQPRLIDVTHLTVYPPADRNGKKHFNFIPPKGLYASD
jgi:hypothetical protein